MAGGEDFWAIYMLYWMTYYVYMERGTYPGRIARETDMAARVTGTERAIARLAELYAMLDFSRSEDDRDMVRSWGNQIYGYTNALTNLKGMRAMSTIDQAARQRARPMGQ